MKPEDYEALADAFLQNPCPVSAVQFVRSNGDLVRYDQAADLFAILRKDRFIKTFFRPDPAIHGEPTNLDYYFREEAEI
jgi:filamentous hemagglutinin